MIGLGANLEALSSSQMVDSAKIPAGRFRMGATPDDLKMARVTCANELRAGSTLALETSPRCGPRFDAETPQVSVFIPTFAIDRTEVTVAAYGACVAARVCRPRLSGALTDDPAWPVDRVSWSEADTYCRSKQGHLPTEAQWEKAARGPLPHHDHWPWGSDFSSTRANHGRPEPLAPDPADNNAPSSTTNNADGFAGRAPVGRFPTGSSPYGVLDLAGNVAEWTSSYFLTEPPQATQPFDPRGPAYATERTVRGGSYLTPPSDLRVTSRIGVAPTERPPGVGFRCAYD